MAGDEERYWNHCSYSGEQEQGQSRSLNDVSDVVYSDSTRHDHQDDDPTAIFNNGVGLVSSVGESSNHQPPSNQSNLHPQEGGPLRLSLTRSLSLANLIESSLNQEKQQKPPRAEKLKAANFHAICLEIGSWKWVSMNGGDLVAKIYYSKKKLIWEFLFGSLKKKMEISWSEISAINAFISQGENGRLEIELNQPPQFSEEINSKPLKHTQWTTSTDFTRDQALICRRHKVEFLPGVIDKHFEKLMQCDKRLLHLSRQPFPIHNSPFFPTSGLNFSHNQSVTGCSLVPISNCHHQALLSHVQNLVPPSFVPHSSSSLTSSALNRSIPEEMQITGGAWEQKEELQIQETFSLQIREQDHFLPYHGPESMITYPQSESYQNVVQMEFSDEQNCFNSDPRSIAFDHQQHVEGNNYQNNSDIGGNGVWEHKGILPIQETSSLPIGEQDQFLPYLHGPESTITYPQLEAYQNGVAQMEQNFSDADSISKAFDHQLQFFIRR